jgi:hypothetical protein
MKGEIHHTDVGRASPFLTTQRFENIEGMGVRAEIYGETILLGQSTADGHPKG